MKYPASRVTTKELGGGERYLAHVSTDKPIYRTGEQVYVRCVVLHALDKTPLKKGTEVFFEIQGPKGDTLASGYSRMEDSVAGWAWGVPEGQAGGQHKVKVTFPVLGIPPAERPFDVRAYRTPRLRTQIIFFRDGYGPGDEVIATVSATRAEGGFPENAHVQISAMVDGQRIHDSTGMLDGEGRCTTRFSLPKEIQRGDGTLAFVIKDGGVVESASKTLPILLQVVDVSLFPEGGDLVAGLPCRLYLEARTPSQKPADIEGIVVDEQDKQVASFNTEHEGRGRFILTPQKGKSYSLLVTRPAGIVRRVPLPEIQDGGTVLVSTRDVYAAGRPVIFKVMSTQKGPLRITLSKKEKEVASVEGIKMVARSNDDTDFYQGVCSLTPTKLVDGVLIATVWNEEGQPLAERLIFRQPSQSVVLSIKTDLERYMPGGKARITVTSKNIEGDPVRAMVGLTVTDDSVLEMIETREQAPQLPVMVLLEEEVEELADAHVYLNPEKEEAPLALDLLLGTQGWRRFAWMNATKFLEKYGDDARRVLAMRVVTRMEQEVRVKAAGPMMRRFAAVDEMAMPQAVAEGWLGAEPPMEPGAGGARDEMVDALERAQQGRQRESLLVAEDMDKPGSMAMDSSVMVREYAHTTRLQRKPNDRVDFTETVYWCAGVATDPKTGEAEVEFELSDSITSFRILADGFTEKGALGCARGVLESVKPFYCEPKLPLEVTQGDRLLVPVAAVNGTLEALGPVAMSVRDLSGVRTAKMDPIPLGAEERVRRLVELTIGDVSGNLDFVLDAQAGPYTDRVTRTLHVVPRGFPVQIAEGGILEPGRSLVYEVAIPESCIPVSVTSKLMVYPAPLANLVGALEALLREPYGCFEQTSSTTYPLVMAQTYFLTHQGVDPQLVERSQDLLRKGYDKLIGFECQKHGYEWFGEDPGHEALTAYGLMQFTDMARVYAVDPQMLSRTRTWLLNTRDGQGGFKRERRALHTWIEDEDCSNAYITWALLQAGESLDSLGKEVDQVLRSAHTSQNSYVLALASLVAWKADRKSEAMNLMKRLADRQAPEGFVDQATMSIVGSGGIALQVETTALALLSWLQMPDYANAVEKGIHWIAEICKAGRYGSTQSTVLALKAILAYDQARARPKAPGRIEMTVDGTPCGGPWEFDETSHGVIQLTDISELLEPGKHVVEIFMKDGSPMPCSLEVTYSDEKPASSQECQVEIQVSLSQIEVEEGNIVEANVTVRSRAEDKILPMTVAIIGIPGGLEVRHDQLKELVKASRIAAYEVLGREVVLYWRSLKAMQTVEVPLSLVAALPGTYTGPASRAYLYYTDEFKSWADPLSVTVVQAP